MEHTRYRWTNAMLDVPFLMGAASCDRLTGPSLVALLAGLGRAESASRNLLTRMVAMGALTSERVGRTNVFALTAVNTDRFREVEGTASPSQWSGSFDALLYLVPEHDRTQRDRLLHRAKTAGYGLLRPGVLIAGSPRTGRVDLDPVELGARAWLEYSTLTPPDLATARRMADRAWDLTNLAEQYRAGIELASSWPTPVPATFASLVMLRDRYAQFLVPQLADPHLPQELLPDQWPQPRFAAALVSMNRIVGQALLPLLRDTAAAADPAGLNHYYPPPWS